MSAPINLNKARKARAKVEKRTRSDENAARFGRSKAQKQAERSQRDQARKLLDGHKREP